MNNEGPYIGWKNVCMAIATRGMLQHCMNIFLVGSVHPYEQDEIAHERYEELKGFCYSNGYMIPRELHVTVNKFAAIGEER